MKALLRWLLCGLVFLFSARSLSALAVSGSGAINGASWEASASAAPLGGGVYRVTGITTNNGVIISGIQVVVYSLDNLAVGGGTFGSTNVTYSRTASGSQTWVVDAHLTASARYLHVAVFGQDAAYDPTGGSNKITRQVLADFYAPALEPQNISVTRDGGQPAAMIGVNETWSVSGAASGASLELGASEGANVIIYNGKLIVTPTAENYSVGVRAGATFTHSASNVATASGQASPYARSWEFYIPTNNNNVAISWRVVQGANVLGSGEIAPGFSGHISGTAPEPYPDPELQFASKYKYDLASERWVPVQSGEEEWTTVQIAELSDLPTSYSGSASVPKIGGQNNGSNSTIWNSVNPSNENDLLTKGVYATGVSKLEDGIRSSAASIAQAGQTLDVAAGKIDAAAGKMNDAAEAIGGAATSFSELGAKMDRVGDAAEAVRDNTEESNTKFDKILGWLGLGDDAPEQTDVGQAQQRAAERDTYESAGGIAVGHTPMVSTGSAGTLLDFSETIQIADRDIEISLSPSALGSAVVGHDILSSAKPLVLVAVVIGFLGLIGAKISVMVQSASQVNAADAAVGLENFAPTVPQAKTWGAAAVITGALVAFAVALVLLVSTIAGGVGVALSGVGNISISAIGFIVAWVEQYFPLVPALTLMVAGATADYWLMPMYLGVAGLIKFIKA